MVACEKVFSEKLHEEIALARKPTYAKFKVLLGEVGRRKVRT